MAITKTGQQLVKEAATRWKDFIQNMSKANRNRIINSGVVKTQDAYIDGINRGTVNIINRYGYTRGNVAGLTPAQIAKNKAQVQADRAKALAKNDQIGADRNLNAQAHQNFDPNYGINPLANPANHNSWDGMSTVPYWKAIYTKGATIPNEIKSPEGQRLFNALANRHEAYEAIAAEKAYANYLKNPQRGDRRAIRLAKKLEPSYQNLTDQEILTRLPIADRAALNIKTTGQLRSNLALRPVAGHLNIDVLGKERKLLDTFPYKDNGGYKFFQKIRDREYEYMDRAGDYQAKQNPGLLSRFLMKLHLKKPDQGTLERYNKNNFRKMTSKIKQKTPVQMGNGEIWTPFY